MSYVKIDSSVRTHPKFLAAGPAASWLWFCGNAYCQDGLTDGFIPESALRYLGVPKAEKLVGILVSAGLWDVAAGGWIVCPLDVKPPYRVNLRHLLGRLKEIWGDACVYCGARPHILEIEHITPVARGGTDRQSNLTLACRGCNNKKRTRTAAEFGFPEIQRRADAS